MMLTKTFSLPPLRAHWLGITLVLSLAVNIAFALGYYQRTHLATSLAESPAARADFIRQQLQFTPQQDREFSKFLAQIGAARTDLRNHNQELADGLWTELTSPRPDLTTLTGYSDQMTTNRAAEQRLLLELTLPFLDQLDPGQRAQFLRIIQAQRSPLTPVLRGN